MITRTTAIATRPPAAPSVGQVGCAGTCSNFCPPARAALGCATCPRRAPSVGFTLPDFSNLSSIDWQTWLIVAGVAILVYHLAFGEKATSRRRAISQARASYKGKIAQIKAGV